MKAHINTLVVNNGSCDSIDITINGKTQTVKCWSSDLRPQGRAWTIRIYDIACKFQTGNKIWPAQIVYWPEHDSFSALEPVNYSRVNGRRRTYQLVGFESDFQDSDRRSQHNGGYKN